MLDSKRKNQVIISAIRYKDNESVKALVDHGADISSNNFYIVGCAEKYNNFDAIKWIIPEGAMSDRDFRSDMLKTLCNYFEYNYMSLADWNICIDRTIKNVDKENFTKIPIRLIRLELECGSIRLFDLLISAGYMPDVSGWSDVYSNLKPDVAEIYYKACKDVINGKLKIAFNASHFLELYESLYKQLGKSDDDAASFITIEYLDQAGYDSIRELFRRAVMKNDIALLNKLAKADLRFVDIDVLIGAINCIDWKKPSKEVNKLVLKMLNKYLKNQ